MVNTASGMASASAWDEYRDNTRDDLDLITGFQIVDSTTRLFVLEARAVVARRRKPSLELAVD